MGNKNNKEIIVFMDDDANYCVIVGTEDRDEAEKALRETENEWYGDNHEEAPIPIDDFYMADIYYGELNGEPFYYWGPKEKIKFPEHSYELLPGFVASLL